MTFNFKTAYRDESLLVIQGDVIETLSKLRAESVQTCVTSPPYWGLRDYGVTGQLGLEATPDEYVTNLVNVFRGVRRLLREDGTLWLNLGDSYASGGKSGADEIPNDYMLSKRSAGSLRAPVPPGLKTKDLVGIPWRVAFALQGDGWYLRSDIIWHKPNPMPESVTDRPTKAHEYMFLMTKAPRYYYDGNAILEPLLTPPHKPGNKKLDESRNDHDQMEKTWGNPKGKNRRSVWSVSSKPYRGAHFATFPPDLIEPCILAGAPIGGTVLDPFAGSGTTLMVARQHNRRAIGIELNPEYIPLILERCGASARPDESQAAIKEAV